MLRCIKLKKGDELKKCVKRNLDSWETWATKEFDFNLAKGVREFRLKVRKCLGVSFTISIRNFNLLIKRRFQ